MQDILKSNTPAFVFDTAVLQKRAAQQCHFVIP